MVAYDDSVEGGIVLGPGEVVKVVRPFGLFRTGGVFAEYDGEVMVGAVAVPVQGFCPPNVAVGDFFANVSGARVQCKPNGFGGVGAEFDEMVATAQGAALADGGLFACGHVDAEVGETLEVAGESLADEPVGFRMGARVAWWLGPTGTAASHAARSGARLSRRSLVVRLVRTAIMPQPMSPPTAAGDTASRMAMTLPMVTAAPTCTSGIMATPWVQGRSATARIWRCAA